MCAGERFCLQESEEADAPLCLEAGYDRCGIRVLVEDAGPLDCVILRPCRGCFCRTRMLLCCKETIFAGLAPGGYQLTLVRPGMRAELAVKLSPGGNVTVRWNGCRRRWSWKRDWFHCVFNRR